MYRVKYLYGGKVVTTCTTPEIVFIFNCFAYSLFIKTKKWSSGSYGWSNGWFQWFAIGELFLIFLQREHIWKNKKQMTQPEYQHQK